MNKRTVSILCKVLAGLAVCWLGLGLRGEAAVLVTPQESRPYQEAQLKVPQLAVVPGGPEVLLNEGIHQTVSRWLSEYRQERGAVLARSQAEPEEQTYPLRLQVDYDVRYNDGSVISLLLHRYQQAGQVAGKRETVGMTLRVSDGQQLRLADLFVPGDAYAKRLNALIAVRPECSRYCFQGIRENQTFYLTAQGLVVYFRPYEIAPARLGQVEFLIPYAEVADLLKTEYRDL